MTKNQKKTLLEFKKKEKSSFNTKEANIKKWKKGFGWVQSDWRMNDKMENLFTRELSFFVFIFFKIKTKFEFISFFQQNQLVLNLISKF